MNQSISSVEKRVPLMRWTMKDRKLIAKPVTVDLWASWRQVHKFFQSVRVQFESTPTFHIKQFSAEAFLALILGRALFDKRSSYKIEYETTVQNVSDRSPTADEMKMMWRKWRLLPYLKPFLKKEVKNYFKSICLDSASTFPLRPDSIDSSVYYLQSQFLGKIVCCLSV